MILRLKQIIGWKDLAWSGPDCLGEVRNYRTFYGNWRGSHAVRGFKLRWTSLYIEVTMFVQVFETFSALNNFWLTTPSNPLEFFTAQSSFFSSIQLSTFFCCKCIVFAVRGVPMLRVQKYQEIETYVTLGNDDFGWWMMTIWQVNVMQMSHFSSCLEAKFGLLPFLKTALHLTIYKFV